MSETTGQRLRRLRGKRTLKEASDGIGIAPTTLAMYEYDKRSARDDIKKRIAQYYGRSVAYIFFNTGTREMRG